jgi:hypothetical protein
MAITHDAARKVDTARRRSAGDMRLLIRAAWVMCGTLRDPRDADE